ncbi:MAG: 50S ribosomal protein L10 [Acidimicrobiales bacterium]
MATVHADKAAVVEEVAARAHATGTAVVTQYRGLTVAQISTLRRRLRALGADYKVFKNTLVRRAIAGTAIEPLTGYLEGPTAIAFVDGDVSAVAKALRDFTRQAPALIVKGGVLDGHALTAADLVALADLPSREVLLAQVAGMLAAPMRTLAGLLKALPQNLAYGLAALRDARGGAPASEAPDAAAEVAPADEPAAAAPEVEAEVAPADEPAAEVAPADEPAVAAPAEVADAGAQTAEPTDAAS